MDVIYKMLSIINTISILAVFAAFAFFMFRQGLWKSKQIALFSVIVVFFAGFAGMQAFATENTNASEQRKAKLAAKTIRMTGQIVTAMNVHYGKKPEGLFGGVDYCREDGYCSVIYHPFSISIYGAGLATIRTSKQSAFVNYIELCAVTFGAISGSSFQFAREAMAGAFSNAVQQGSFKTDIGSVQIKISPGIDNIQSCQFFKYGQ